MNWTITISIIIAIISLVWSVANTLAGRQIATKITTNDLVHLEADVKELKQGEKEYKVDLKGELNRIFRRLGHIEKQIVKREVTCELRHGKK